VCKTADRTSAMHSLTGRAKLRGQVLRPCQLALTVILSSDVAVKSCIERLTINYIIQAK